MDGFAERYQLLQAEIAQQLAACGRGNESIRVLAVSKTFPAAAIEEAYACGVRMFGENKIQELALKAEALPKDIEWHFIGHLQSNKAAKAVQYASWIHSVDSIKLLNKLDRCAGEQGKRPRILLEVNSGEEAKSGVDYSELSALAEAALKAENLEFCGLMTMAPLCDDPAVWQQAFLKLKAARDGLEKEFSCRLSELSMGMTGDMVQAIAAGSTIVRIGSRLFGNRSYPQA